MPSQTNTTDAARDAEQELEEYRDAAHFWQDKWAKETASLCGPREMIVSIRGGTLESVDGIAPGTKVIVYEETIDGKPLSIRYLNTEGK